MALPTKLIDARHAVSGKVVTKRGKPWFAARYRGFEGPTAAVTRDAAAGVWIGEFGVVRTSEQTDEEDRSLPKLFHLIIVEPKPEEKTPFGVAVALQQSFQANRGALTHASVLRLYLTM